jgi:hypothetical protein
MDKFKVSMGHKLVFGRMPSWKTPLSKINIHPYIILYARKVQL